MQFALPLLIIGTGAMAARAQQNAGKMANIEAKERAQQEQDAGRDREIERRRRLVSALASQNAAAGAAGIDPGAGSARAIALADAKRAGLESLTDRAGTNRRALMLREQGRFAQRQGNVMAATTLLSTAADAKAAWPGPRAPKVSTSTNQSRYVNSAQRLA